MAYILLGLVLLFIFILVAVKVGISQAKPEDADSETPVIHKSGIYSIVRRTPRESISNHKPPEEEIRKYLDSQNEDLRKRPLNEGEKNALIEDWGALLEKNIMEIEKGDREGIEFYLYRYSGDDEVCERTIPNNCFVSREQIFKYPSIIPPFHLGCTCELTRYHGDEDMRDTTSHRYRRLFDQNNLPKLPEWKQILAKATTR